ncbi:hypothetical protein ACFQ6E_23000 [Streptomyces sp. NPDC056462]|uniref:hypothetical protein n=1 Tax=Streptomyces sp. NPDC056462 TaxID=3345826 RepID=UPI00367B4B8D
MGEQEFDKLLDSMPRIVESINAFTSEDVQKKAFEALVGALNISAGGIEEVEPDLLAGSENGTGAESATDEYFPESLQSKDSDTATSNASSPERKRRRSKPKRNWTAVKDIGFRPAGKTSFKEFIEEKQPSSIDLKGLAAVYYFEQILELEEIGVGHVMAAYKEAGWRNPSNPENSLQATSSRHHWLDTSNMKAIRTTPRGRDWVEHDMPAQKN